jgi:hypothetical protein
MAFFMDEAAILSFRMARVNGQEATTELVA